eukprot:345016_1
MAIIITTLFMVVFMVQTNGWTLAYHHDSNGGQISGSIHNLVSDIQRGYDLRVVRITDDGTNVIIPEGVWTRGERAYVQSTLIGVSFDNNDNLKFKYPNDYYYSMTFDSTGRLDAARYYIDNGSPLSETEDYRYEAKWFTQGA